MSMKGNESEEERRKMMIEEMYELIKILEVMNSNLERIAKALERALPPHIITATNNTIKSTELRELINPSCTEATIATGCRVFNPVTMKWSDEGE